MRLDVRVRSGGGAVHVDVNNLPDLRVDLDMHVTGTAKKPSISGSPRGANGWSSFVLALAKLFIRRASSRATPASAVRRAARRPRTRSGPGRPADPARPRHRARSRAGCPAGARDRTRATTLIRGMGTPRLWSTEVDAGCCDAVPIFSSDASAAQPQRVGDHRDRAKVIAAAAIIGDSRRPNERVEHARRDRHAERVVDEGEEQVLPDVRASSRATARARATMPRRSPFTSVTPALSIATSVPVPIAMPTSACASAGASLMPSPAIATMRPSRLQPLHRARPSARAAPRRSTSSMPSLPRDRLGGGRGCRRSA